MTARRDWTKLLVPRLNHNGERYTADLPADSLDTTDLVSVPSLSELKAMRLPFPTATAFAHPNAAITGRFMHLLTRTPCSYESIYCTNGSFNVLPDLEPCNVDRVTGAGVTPSISLRLPAHYTWAQLAQEFGLTKTDNGLYQVQVGEYPQTAVDAPAADRRCTGRWYTSFMRPADRYGYVSKQNPEYEDQHGKYVLLAEYNLERWYKVEPLTWWVTNSAAVANGTATQLDLTCQQMIIGRVPFNQSPLPDARYLELWQNSLMRAWLNSADSRELDGNPYAKPIDSYWDYRQGGFLQQALNMTREPTWEYTVAAGEEIIGEDAFIGCHSLTKLVIPNHVKKFEFRSFNGCSNLRLQIDLQRDAELDVTTKAFQSSAFKYLYLPRDPNGRWLWLTPDQDPTLAADYYATDFDCESGPEKLTNLLDANYRQNFIQLHNWRQQGKIKFMPPKFTLMTFPASTMANYFVNNNHKRWAELVKGLHFDLLPNHQQKINSLTDLMKIYYALGGFSAKQTEREQAYQTVQDLTAELVDESFVGDPTPINLASWLGNEIHERYSRLEFKGPHNPTFAQFFIRYYNEEGPDFMWFTLGRCGRQDYLCAAHNGFDELLREYPNRVVNGNTERDLITPRFVAEHCSVVPYADVKPENRPLAELVGGYGYTQEQFDRMQTIFAQAKSIKDRAVIRATPTATDSTITYRVLAKDDPLGFVIGDITNCCQHLGGVGSSCVIDGYNNPHAGFMVWETDVQDADEQTTEQKRILGQAYVWYDPVTQTVCYDNIEIPNKVLTELKRGEKHHAPLSTSGLMQAVIDSADSIMTAMNQNGTPVKRVTVGKAYNDLAAALGQFALTDKPATHRGYVGYTDAEKQYLIRTAEQVPNKLTTVTVGGKRGLKTTICKSGDGGGIINYGTSY